MSNRRAFLLLCFGSVLSVATRPAQAQTTGDRATAFVQLVGDRILAAMRGAGSVEERRKILGPIIGKSIDVDGVAKFCLGRFWRTATPDQQKRYTELFHQVLIGNITSKSPGGSIWFLLRINAH